MQTRPTTGSRALNEKVKGRFRDFQNILDTVKEAREAFESDERALLEDIRSKNSELARIVEGSENLLKEIKSYKWKEDKNGHVLDEPVKFRNHLMDGMRYYLGEKVFEGEIGYDFVSSDTPGGDRETAHQEW